MSHGPRFGFAAPVATRQRVPLPGWSGRARLVHLTDLHFGNVTPPALQRAAIALTNAEAPDLIVITGDFLARGRRHLERMAQTLSELDAPVLAVLGNHDHWVDGRAVTAALRGAGVEVISNGWTRWNSLSIVCLDDLGTGHADADLATRGLGAGPSVALSHNPEAAPELWARGVSLVLSGHTHGGQVHVPSWTPALYEKLVNVRFLSGWYGTAGRRVFVNPGVGSSVLPWRYGRPAMRSVAVFDLVGAPARR